MQNDCLKVLIVEDNENYMLGLEYMIYEGFKDSCLIDKAPDFHFFKNKAGTGLYDIILLDLMLPDSSGLDTLKNALVFANEIPIIVMTSVKDEYKSSKAIKMGAQDYLFKGEFDSKLLKRAINYSIERKKILLENERKEERYKALLNIIPETIFRMSVSGEIIDCYCNPSREPCEIIDNCVYNHVIKAGNLIKSNILGHIKNVIEKGASYSFEYSLEIDNVTKYFELRAVRFNENTAVCILQEITKRKKRELEIKESKKLLDIFFESSLDATFFMMLDEPIEWNDNIDKDKTLKWVFGHQRITRLNNEMVNQYEATWEDLIGRTPNDFFQDNLEQGYKIWNALFDKGRLRLITDEVTFKDNRIKIEGDYICIYDDYGHIRGHFGIQRDITDKKIAEEKLKKQEEYLHSIIHTSLDGLIVVNVNNGKIIDTNNAYCKMIGYSREEILNLSVFDLEAEETQKETESHFKELIETGSGRFQTKHKHKQGKQIDIDASVMYLDFKGGVFVSFIRDITRTNELLNALKTSEQNFNQLANSVKDVFFLRTQDEMIFVNKAYEEIWGRTRESLYENPISFIDTVFKEDRERIKNIFFSEEYKKTGKFDEIYRIVRPDKSLRWVRVKTEPVFDEYGSFIRTAGVVEDITDIKNAEKEREELINKLQKANEELKELSAMKDDFLAIASHDLRSPFTSILGFSELLIKDPELSEEHRAMVKHIYSSVKRQLEYVNDILDIIKIESGNVKLDKGIFNIKGLVQESVNMLYMLAEKKQIKINIDIKENFKLNVDYLKLLQVFNNLISNAVKFTQPGGVINIFNVFYGDFVEIHIEDSGLGIPEEKLGTLFTRYKQHHTSGTSGEAGTGLGLVICKNLIELHGGEIFVKSESDKGSDFYFKLKIEN